MNGIKPKFVIVIHHGTVAEVYANCEIEYAIVNYDRRNPVEGVYNTEDAGGNLQAIWYPRHAASKKEYRLNKLIFRKLLKLKFW